MFGPPEITDLPLSESQPTPEMHFDDWFESLSQHHVKALAVLGPQPFGETTGRSVYLVHPAEHAQAASALCDSSAYGSTWRSTHSPLVAWSNFDGIWRSSDADWITHWGQNDLVSMVRVEIPLPLGRAHECFLFLDQPIASSVQAAELTYAVMGTWPLIKQALRTPDLGLSEKEVQTLRGAANGMTARLLSEHLGCTERTVTFHWSNARAKLRSRNTMEAVTRAMLLGII